MAKEEHYLNSYLSKILPSLGLDYDTYNPYITGLFALEDESNAVGQAQDGFDEDTLDDIMQLLQSSSETHDEDEEQFIEMKKTILKLKNEHDYNERRRKEGEAVTNQKLAEERAKLAILSVKEEEEAARKQQAAKKLLKAEQGVDVADIFERYGYDEEDTSGGKKNDESEVEVQSNREVAKQLDRDRTANVRNEASKKFQSKNIAREATNRHKADKMKKKEDRKKKAVKGERKR